MSEGFLQMRFGNLFSGGLIGGSYRNITVIFVKFEI